jgi:hypothetical protein
MEPRAGRLEGNSVRDRMAGRSESDCTGFGSPSLHARLTSAIVDVDLEVSMDGTGQPSPIQLQETMVSVSHEHCTE